ncbi:MAG: protease inhibitor I42 family protein [Dehalococcoidia bacterium]
MRIIRWFMVAGVAAVGLGLFAACGDDDDSEAADDLKLTDGDNGKAVTVAVQGTLTVVLVSNATTGYSWRVSGDLPGILEQQGEPVYATPPATASPVVGAAGTETFTFRAVQKGDGTLKLEYVRPFETGVPPAQTFEVTVSVE